MARAAVKTKPSTTKEPLPPPRSKAVAPTNTGSVPAVVAEQFKVDAGKGVSTAQEDNLVPLVYILQNNSPQVNKRDGAYIEGAEAGMIWLKNAPEPLVSGEEGAAFQPCAFQKNWVEWIPRDAGGGLVAITPNRPSEAKEIKDGNVVKYVMPNGNEVKETRYHFGYIHIGAERLPYCIPLTSTGHTVSRDLMSRMRSKGLPDGTRAPSWAYLYRLKTVHKTNKKGQWFQFTIEDIGWVETVDDYNRGKALFHSIDTGAKSAALDEDAQTTDDGGDGAM